MDTDTVRSVSVPEFERPFVRRLLISTIEVVAAILLGSLIALMLWGVVSRYVLTRPLIFGDELSSLMFVWLIMLGSILALDRFQHMRLSLFIDMLDVRSRELVNAIALLVVPLFLITILPAAIEHVQMESFLTLPALGISGGWKVASVPCGLVIMLLIASDNAIRGVRLRNLILGVIVLAALIALLFLLKPFFLGLGRWNIAIFLVGILLLFLFIGVPIAFCFGLATVSFLVFSTNLPLTVVIGRMDEGMGSPILLAVPVFVLLGAILDLTGMGKAIVTLLSSLVGHLRGGMSYVLLGSLYLVSGISGSKLSDMATVAPALFPEMKRRGRRPPEMVALLGTGAIMADTVPPSIILIIIGSVAGVSIAALFSSGFIVALWLLAALAIGARWNARKEDLTGVKRPALRLIWSVFIIALPALVLPFLIRAAVGEGIATATEVSTVAVVYAYIVGTTIYGHISSRQAYRALVETVTMTGAIMLIMGTASAGAWALTQTGIGQVLGTFIAGLPGGWISFMGITILVFVFFGCMLEGPPAIVLFAPLMFPIAISLGIHPVHYAMVVVVSMNIGMFIPPIGIMYYIACSFGNVRPQEAIGDLAFYLSLLGVALILLALVPAISIGLI